MPAVPPPSKVLVTGASSFIGTHVIKQLLEAGYAVIGTVRSQDKANYVRGLFKEHADTLSFVIVEDIEKKGAFDEAVVGMDAVEHIASPFHMSAGDPQEMIGPAVNGTIGVLQSVYEHAPTVKRVVVTSSLAAIQGDPKPIGYHWTEDDWNITGPKTIEEKGKDAPGGIKYSASKTLAERAAWDFVKKHEVKFDLVTVNPSYVFGPTIHEIKSVDSLNTSINIFRQHTIESQGRDAKPEDLHAPAGSCVDVRDVALVHVKALGKEEAGGQRFLASAGPFTWNQVLTELKNAGIKDSNAPKEKKDDSEPEHRPAIGTKAEKTFGFKYRALQDVAVDTYKSIKERFY